MGRSMDWKLEDNIVSGLIFFAPLTTHRSSHVPFVQTEEGPTLFLAGLFQGGWVGGESAESRSALQSIRIPSVIHPEGRTSAIIVR